MLVPLFGDDPVELGMRGREDELIQRLRDESRVHRPVRRRLPRRRRPAHPDQPRPRPHQLRTPPAVRRLALRPLPRGDRAALSEPARRGARAVQQRERLECFHCHAGFNFQDSVAYAGKPLRSGIFHNTGLYNLDGAGGYPPGNTRPPRVHRRRRRHGPLPRPDPAQHRRHRPLHARRQHRHADEVLDHYAAGGRTITDGPHAGRRPRQPLQEQLHPRLRAHGRKSAPTCSPSWPA
jgi:cytochrome c peroxidase